MRLIDADALIPMIKYATIDNEIGVFPIRIGFDAIVKVINEQPTIEAVQERKGRWIGKDDDSEMYDSYWCDQCHHEITVDAKRFCDIGFVIEDFKFCPNCGADMRGEEDETN